MTSVSTPSTSTFTDGKQQMNGINLGLPRIMSLLKSLNSPHLSTPIIHIAGTNGKGSTSAYLNSILLRSNFKLGKFNSPFLLEEWDCITLNGETVQEAEFKKVKLEVEKVNEVEGIGASSFEILTAIAFKIFSITRPKLDLAIIEVGLGGLTDATNVVPPSGTLLSIITSIELDHQAFLGNTLEEITKVKSGIIKEGVDVVVAKQAHPVVIEEIKKLPGSIMHFAGEGIYVFPSILSSSSFQPSTSLPTVASFLNTNTPPGNTTPILAQLPLPGAYQLSNAATAILAAQVLRSSFSIRQKLSPLDVHSIITDENIKKGIETTKWPGRLDWIDLSSSTPSDSTSTSSSTSTSNPPTTRSHHVLLDGAHNPSSAIQLATYLNSLPSSISPTTLILALSSPRSPSSILLPLLNPTSQTSRINKVILVPFSKPVNMEWINSTSPADLAEAAREIGTTLGRNLEIVERENVKLAIQELDEGEKVVVAGSLYLVADVYRLVKKEKTEQMD